MKSYDAYLFDADGTLIDTTELIYRCFRNTLDKYADRRIDRESVVRSIGLPLRQQLECHLGRLSDDRAQEISAYHMDHQLSIYPAFLKTFPGITEAVRRLKEGGKRLAVVTSRMPRTLELYLRHTGLLTFFDVLVTPASTRRHKPHPEPVLEALRLLGCGPEEAVMIGDATFDIECGRRAGTDTAFVAWSRNSLSSLAVTPTYILQSPADLLPEAKRTRAAD